MYKYFKRKIIAFIVVIAAILACNYPSATQTPDVAATWVAATLTALSMNASAPQVVLTEADTVTPVPTFTNQPSSTPTPGNPVVIHDALCSQGPGSVYEVVSSVKTGTVVELIGRGSISGWYIITNPIYKDPCWIAAVNLQIDPSYDLSVLKVYNPPSTPTPRPTKVPTPTP